MRGGLNNGPDAFRKLPLRMSYPLAPSTHNWSQSEPESLALFKLNRKKSRGRHTTDLLLPLDLGECRFSVGAAIYNIDGFRSSPALSGPNHASHSTRCLGSRISINSLGCSPARGRNTNHTLEAAGMLTLGDGLGLQQCHSSMTGNQREAELRSASAVALILSGAEQKGGAEILAMLVSQRSARAPAIRNVQPLQSA